ncbi:MAG: type 4a pilus biogenesis protein PilO [Phycisphaerae bacterium]|nr:type 4a pilus biogenesis protein PilO [Phycisphaerae bacterium]
MKWMDKQQITILILGAIILIGFGVFQYVPIVRRKLALKEQMTRQSLSMDQIQDYSRRLPELHQQKKELEKELQLNSGKIPEGKQFAQLWQQIAEVMNECNLQKQLVQPAAEKISEDICCVPLKIECEGTLQQIFTFFQLLEGFDRLICFEEIQLENDKDFNAVLKLNAKANVYYQPQKTGSS